MSCHTVSPDLNSHNFSNDDVKAGGDDVEGCDDDDLDDEMVSKTENGRKVHEAQEECEELICRVCDPVDDDIDDECEEESERPRSLRDPGAPSWREIQEHNLTHIPPRPWCPHCVRGKSKDSPSLRIAGEFAECLVPRVRLDYCFLTEADGTSGEATEAAAGQEESGQTVLVMQESECRSVWAYAVDQKGAGEEWVVHQICEDLETIGLKDDRLIVKEDQENSAVDVAREVARNRGGRFGTAIDNSRVGDSDSNGTIERAIQDVEGQCRTMRSALEEKLKTKITLSSPITPWLIRHAAYLITRCRVRPNGRTAFQMLKGRRSNGKLAEFGEIVHFLIPKTKDMPGKFDDRWSEGVWLGCDVRSGEHLIGMDSGVFRVSTVRAKTRDTKWSTERIASMTGKPGQPVPGQRYNRSPAFTRKFGQAPRTDAEYAQQDPIPVSVRSWKIYKTDILNDQIGPTPGCPGCRAVMTDAPNKQPHTVACRLRVQRLIEETEEGKQRLARSELRRSAAQSHQASRQGGEDAADHDAAEDIDVDDEKETPQRPQEEDEYDPSAAREHDDELVRRIMRQSQSSATASSSTATPAATSAQASMSQGANLDTARAKLRQELERRRPGTKRKAGEPTDDGSRDANENPPQVRGQKRGAEEEPDDPRLVGSGPTSEVVQETNRATTAATTPADSTTTATSRTAASVEVFRKRCATCGCKFASRNQLHNHIRKRGHRVKGEPPMEMLEHFKTIGSHVELARTDEPMDSVGKGHPGPRIPTHQITARDQQWHDIGSGMVARTFKQVRRLRTTSPGGPCMDDIFKRKIWSLSTGKVIDECEVDNVGDKELEREMKEVDDIRVELTLKDAVSLYQRKGPDIIELYSQPRICQEVGGRKFDGMELTPGYSLDLTLNDPATGEPWDLGKPAVQSRVKKLIRDTKPFCVIGSPPCTAFSALQEISRAKRDPREMQRQLDEAKAHIRFCVGIYLDQIKNHRHFVHEHPEGSKAWSMPEMVDLLSRPEVGATVFHMCAFGMTGRDEKGEAPVKKGTRVVSSSEEVLKRISRRCSNEIGRDRHRHVHLIQGRAKEAQVYPRELAANICEGIAAQKKIEALGVTARSIMSVEKMMEASGSKQGECPSEALHEAGCEGLEAYDDVTGQQLDPKLMMAARRDEIQYFRDMGVYEKVNVQECWNETGKAPIAVRWVDINKGDTANPNYRSRLVAKEFNTGPCPELYAATPPSECLRILLSKAASGRGGGIGLMYADVSRAYFYARAVRPVYVKLPEEDVGPGDAGKCGRLMMSMYGTRDAALNWALEYGETLRAAGYDQGKSNPCLFYHKENDVAIMVHGDDFVAVGPDAHLDHVRRTLSDKYKIKVEQLGKGQGQSAEVRILNKVVRITESGIELEADPRHAELVVKDLGLDGAKASAVPGAKSEAKGRNESTTEDAKPKRKSTQDRIDVGNDVDSIDAAKMSMDGDDWSGDLDNELEMNDDDDEELDPASAKIYRAVAARLNYISPDRPDIGFAVKEVARRMSKPRTSDMKKLRKIGRYLIGRPRLVLKFIWQEIPDRVVAFTDSDWAGCGRSAKSTSGGAICLGEHVLKTFCKQQKVIALSSAEAELYAMVAASAEAIAMAAYGRDLGLDLDIDMYCDSAAALGITNRAGIGKVRHLRTQGLWVQEARVSGRIAYKKVLGEKNPADLLTKHLSADVTSRHIETLNMTWVGGRAESAPTLDSVESMVQGWYEDYIEETVIDEPREKTIDELHESVGATEGDSVEETMSGGKRKRKDLKVSFANTVTVRPIPASGRGRRTPARGSSGKATTQWPSKWGQDEPTIDEIGIRGRGAASRESGCRCLLVRGDGRRWGDEETEIACTACAGNWKWLKTSIAQHNNFGDDIDVNSVEVQSIAEHRAAAEISEAGACSDKRRVGGAGNACQPRLDQFELRERRNSNAAPSDLVQLESASLRAMGRRRRSAGFGRSGLAAMHSGACACVGGSVHMRVQRDCEHEWHAGGSAPTRAQAR